MKRGGARLLPRLAPAALSAVCLVTLLAPSTARAQRARRRFEPTDLRLTPAGVTEIDLQAGYLGTDDGARVFAPDVEASVGISERVELEVDTTYGWGDARATFLDDTWVSVRIGLVDVREEGAAQADAAWAAGVQAGPKLPTTPASRKIGFEGLFIAGRNAGPAHVFVQVGGLLDPVDTSLPQGPARPAALEGGLDLDLDLDEVDRFSLKGEVAVQRFFSPHPSQIHLTAGPALRVVPWLELSIVGVAGLLPGADRWGVLVGAAPRFSLF